MPIQPARRSFLWLALFGVVALLAFVFLAPHEEQGTRVALRAPRGE